MSEETKVNEPVKQEGEFKIKKRKPKNLGKLNSDEPIKVDFTKPEAQGDVPEVTKVTIPSEAIKTEDDAIQIGETETLDVGEQTGDSTAVDKQVPESSEVIEEVTPLQEITDEEVKEIKQEVSEAKRDEKVLGKPLPENIEKLVSFMEETGGTVQDYVALNRDYSSYSPKDVLKEYYTKAKPHLDQEEIGFLMEDNFEFDEEIDEPREIRKKKLAFKEEVANAKKFLESSKSKYYDDIKLRPGVTQEQQEAISFYDQYKQQQETATQLHGDFRDRTKKLFNNEFKGFDFKVGEKKFRYGVKDPVKVADNQKDISTFIKTFLNDKGEVVDTKGYHKALYAARNADTIAQHFYEQGKTDAIKSQLAKSKNITTEPRATQDGNVFVNGLRVKAISGLDSSKLKIKTRKFNN